ncbi:16S rRNA (uracil(1498)-N(3))-methyltransferase [Corallincola holothuriorum]|uniref:Ribosomal RNA small subunit methyltransferase E n=1 Tax=Corallincola holothuriorum TaxID=2282215 RepID=A0A368N505_9GAMM|nr:16S rRNA (uracil(1498)-N(3))-methyltransferase [Corallincola holothuriorum]RCU45657.1 16S rRNA (uracil(1498)-N(3))-methyltransferase [Corallincola holothuriorum]
MRNIRLFHPEPLTSPSTVELSSDAAGHVARVLRMRLGDPVTLFNGDGHEYQGTLSDVGKRNVSVQIQQAQPADRESPLAIHLGQGISRGEKMDITIQKSVELGVREITPLITERCGVKLNNERWEKKVAHWQKVAISACEQCGRNRVPRINSPQPLSEWLARTTDATRLTLHPHTDTSFSNMAAPGDQVEILIGPEGGLSEQEITVAEQAQFFTVKLGPRILRTETAALVAISALQLRFGDLG